MDGGFSWIRGLSSLYPFVNTVGSDMQERVRELLSRKAWILSLPYLRSCLYPNFYLCYVTSHTFLMKNSYPQRKLFSQTEILFPTALRVIIHQLTLFGSRGQIHTTLYWLILSNILAWNLCWTSLITIYSYNR